MTSIEDHTQEDNIQCISVNQVNYVLAFLTYIIMVMMTMIVIIIIIRRRIIIIRRRMMMMMMMEIKFVYQLPHFFYMFRTY